MQRTPQSSTRISLYILLAFILLVLLIFLIRGCSIRAQQGTTPTPRGSLPTEIALLTQAAPAAPATTAGPQVVTATAAGAQPGAGLSSTAAQTPASCPTPAGWVRHSVRQDETLYYLATSTGAGVEAVMKANCLASDLIQVGQSLYLPSVPPLRPTFPPPPPPAANPGVLPGMSNVPTSQGFSSLPGTRLGTITPSPTSDIIPPPSNNGPDVGSSETPTPTLTPGITKASPNNPSSPLVSPPCLGAVLVILFIAIVTGLILYLRRRENPAGPGPQP